MSAPRPANFDRLARIYRALEYVAFGRDLERVRFCFLRELRDCRDILIFGDGDGRFLARLLDEAPAARVTSVDASARMLARASARLAPPARQRVTFLQADARALGFGTARYDAVVTLFFLDCFTPPEVEAIAGATAAALTPDARWVFGDFALPARGLARTRARIWLWLLYRFFRWQTGLTAQRLPDMHGAITRAGFVPATTREFAHRMLRATVYRRRFTTGPA